jgi:phosphatidylserine/phosphatidylglycerophosphate/cardiolipin synthase-like enzyme
MRIGGFRDFSMGKSAGWICLLMVLAGAGGGLRAEVTAGARPPLGLFETPRDGEQPVMAAVTGAQESVDVEVYELTDADLLAALSAQERAGRTVRVILNRNFADANSDVNAMAGEVLQMAGTQVHDANPEFTYTHIKTIIVDAGEPTQKVLIMTMNLDPTYLGKFDAANWVTCAPPEAGDFAAAPGKAVMEAGWFGLEEKTVLAADAEAGMRVWPEVLGLDAFLHYTADPTAYSLSLNFGVIDRDPADVAQVETIFNTDWVQGELPSLRASDLVVSPVNSRKELVSQIWRAKRSVHIFAQEFFDAEIVQAAVAAARRGVEVKVLLAPNMTRNVTSANRLAQAGGQARFLDSPYEHAKATIVDGAVVYIGSVNYTATSLDKNRELGILTRQRDIAAQMEAEFARFWSLGTEAPPSQPPS